MRGYLVEGRQRRCRMPSTQWRFQQFFSDDFDRWENKRNAQVAGAKKYNYAMLIRDSRKGGRGGGTLGDTCIQRKRETAMMLVHTIVNCMGFHKLIVIQSKFYDSNNTTWRYNVTGVIMYTWFRNKAHFQMTKTWSWPRFQPLRNADRTLCEIDFRTTAWLIVFNILTRII